MNELIDISKQSVNLKFKDCPWFFCDQEGRTLNHGKAILETEDQCNAYLAAYGPMHRHKLMRALEDPKFPYSALSNGVEIYDWGCGQGIGTMAVIEKLRDKNNEDEKNVTEEEQIFQSQNDDGWMPLSLKSHRK